MKFGIGAYSSKFLIMTKIKNINIFNNILIYFNVYYFYWLDNLILCNIIYLKKKKSYIGYLDYFIE